MLAAIDGQSRSSDEPGVIRHEEYHAPRDLLRLSQPAHRYARHNLFQYMRRHGGNHFRVDISGRDRIHRNTLRCAFLRQRFGKSMDARFRSRAIDLTVLTGLPVDRADTYNTAEASFEHAVPGGFAHIEAAAEIGIEDLIP